jgi:imidazolonepropionase-like amidohydrolase
LHAVSAYKKPTLDLGTVVVGKIADVVAVPGNPIDDISLMKRVSFGDEGRSRL